jgi:hypothetical protein
VALLQLQEPTFYVYTSAALFVGFGLVKLGHKVLDLLRDWRDFRDGY